MHQSCVQPASLVLLTPRSPSAPPHPSQTKITKQLLDHVWGQWCSDLSTILSGLPEALASPSGAQAQPLLLHFERWLLLLKILRRLVVFGFPSDAKTLEPVPAVSACAPALLQAAGALLAARPARAAPSRVVAMVDRGALKLVKTLSQLQEAHPWSFHHAGALLPCMELSCGRVTAHAASGGAALSGAQEDLMICCMLMLGGVLGCDAYHGRMSSLGGRDAQQAERTKSMAAAVHAALDGFWSSPAASAEGGEAAAAGAPRRVALLHALMEGFFQLTARDLQDWSDEPEAWHHAGEGGAWEDSLRPCAEHLYLQLLTVSAVRLLLLLVF